MPHWSGEAETMPVGCKWTYRVKLVQATAAGTRTHLVLGREAFDSREEAQGAGEAHLQAEIEKRSS